eukprot:1154605-Pelagomonas_calceolata.AAC.14
MDFFLLPSRLALNRFDWRSSLFLYLCIFLLELSCPQQQEKIDAVNKCVKGWTLQQWLAANFRENLSETFQCSDASQHSA